MKKTRKTARLGGPLTPGIPDRCGYVVSPVMLDNLAGYTQVWIPTRQYDAYAKGLLRKTKNSLARRMLRRRAAPLGITVTCNGTCSGSCKEVTMPGGARQCQCVKR